MARWALGVSKRAPEAGMRALLGLSSIDGEVKKRQIMWWSRIERMSEDRWPKQMLLEMQSGQYPSKWWGEVQGALTAFHLTKEGVAQTAKPLAMIKAAWRQSEQQRLDQDRAERTSLLCLHRVKFGAWNKQVDRVGWRKWVSKLQIGDNRWRGTGDVCQLCGGAITSLAVHVLTECRDEDVLGAGLRADL
jgi:hypothetical protein